MLTKFLLPMLVTGDDDIAWLVAYIGQPDQILVFGLSHHREVDGSLRHDREIDGSLLHHRGVDGSLRHHRTLAGAFQITTQLPIDAERTE